MWGRPKLDWHRHVQLRNGIPPPDTFGRMSAALNPKQFEACVIRWMSHLFPALAEQVVTIDGKTVRGSHQRGERAIHLVSARRRSGCCTWSGSHSRESNEITAIPELVDAPMLTGAIMTIDAMICQQQHRTENRRCGRALRALGQGESADPADDHARAT